MIAAFLCGAFYGVLVCMVYKSRGRWLTVEGTIEEMAPDLLSKWKAAGKLGPASVIWAGQDYSTIADALAAGAKIIFMEPTLTSEPFNDGPNYGWIPGGEIG